MMKKLLSAALVCLLLLISVPAFSLFTAAAENDLPFPLVAPAYVYAYWLETNDSPTTTNLAYSLSNEMTDFFKRKENAHLNDTIDQFMKDIGCDDIWMNVQIDWALDDVKDDVSGWHYTKYWDGDPVYGLGHDSEGHYCWSEWDIVEGNIGNATETVNTIWVARGVPNDERWNGNPEEHVPGVKDQLRPEQYTYDEENEELHIDFSKHTLYFRMRFVVTVRNDGADDRFYFSDWSNTASTGKGAEAYAPLSKSDLTAPVITDLRMTDKEFNDNPIVAFKLTVPDALMGNAVKAAATGGQIIVEVEGRVKGDKEFVSLQGDWLIKAGEMESALFNLANESRPNVPKDTVVELRCRYRYDHPAYFDDSLWSDWSKVISFGTDDVNYYTDPVDNGTGALDPNAKKTCPICHFCPQPLGLCIFIWLLILLVVIVVVVVVVIVVVKKSKKDKEAKK